MSAVRQASKNEEKEAGKQRAKTRKSKKDSRQLSCNSHCSFDRAMRVEETLMQTLACQLSSSFDPTERRSVLAVFNVVHNTRDKHFVNKMRFHLEFISHSKSVKDCLATFLSYFFFRDGK